MNNPIGKPRKFDPAFRLSTTQAEISVEPNAAYWGDPSMPPEVRLADNNEAHLLLSPTEALAVAAALQAVAVYLLEETPEVAR